jgi:(p)ppGpp synthase/HD superfamily hydrolase
MHTVSPLSAVVLDGSEGASVKYAPCCHPIPGDPIIGFMGKGEGLTVHTSDCAAARRMFGRSPEAWIDLQWADEVGRPFDVPLVVRVDNHKGALARVSSAISSADADIVNVSMTETRNERTTELQFLLNVRDRDHLAEVFRRLRNTPIVLHAWRQKPHD